MADAIENLSELLRPASWSARAAYIDGMLGESFGCLLAADPVITTRDALQLLRARYGPLIRRLAGSPNRKSTLSMTPCS